MPNGCLTYCPARHTGADQPHRIVYKKFVRARNTFKVHDEKNECKIGDRVRIEETRPLSRDKRWRLKAVLEKAKV